jgi:phosphoglycerate dehydrogenase-like enzyme
MSSNTVLLLGNESTDNRQKLEALLTSAWNITTWTPRDSDDDLKAALIGPQAAVIGVDALLSGRVLPQLAQAQGLKLFQIPFSGYDWLPPAALPAGCAACNLHEHASSIAEYVLLAMLEWQIGLRRIDADFRTGSWRYNGSRVMGIEHHEIRGKTVGIFGYGHIGEEVAKRAAAFGMRVVAVGSRPRDRAPAPLEWYGGPESRSRLYAESDFLVLTCSLNEQTRGAIDRHALAAMKPSTVIINVARAPVVVEDDLYAALQERRIAGAVVDVWYREPTKADPSPQPSRHPFQELPNVIMTPHCAGWTVEQNARRWQMIADNLDRLARGQPLRNVVVPPRETAASGESR